MNDMTKLLTIKQASEWASEFLKKKVTPSNISYLIQYGKIKKIGENGGTFVSVTELKKYYESYLGKREINWKEKLGHDLDWHLSFDHLKEADTTKHVHRLHPYKGKFIPQLVEYFLDDHVDEYKKEIYFKKGDIVLDPFCGSGTMLVQANELGMHAVGIDISEFNALIATEKVAKHDLFNLHEETKRITLCLKQFIAESNTVKFEERLVAELARFNNDYFPSPDYKHWLKESTVVEDEYGPSYAKKFSPIYDELVRKHKIQLKQAKSNTFLDIWYLQHVRTEIDFTNDLIEKTKNEDSRKILRIILSRTIRSCRATTHSDLATLVEPVTEAYYCHKHGKICKPLFSILGWWERYCVDTLQRLNQFNGLRTDTRQLCLVGDSRTINIKSALASQDPLLSKTFRSQRIKGIFSSPPYVGLIDYHEQHAYAYDLFRFKRRDNEEIGPLFGGGGKQAREEYSTGIVEVLTNCKKYLSDDYHVFLVANDKYGLYPEIAKRSGMSIVNSFKRPVLNRTERDKGAYAEVIFHLKEGA